MPPPVLDDPIESLGYEIATLLQFSFFGLMGQFIFASFAWTTYTEANYHLGFASVVIYIVIFVASFEHDMETLHGELCPPNEDSQAVRIVVDLVFTMACWDYWKFSDIFGLSPKQTASPDLVMMTGWWAPLSCVVFMMGSYIGCLAHLSLLRVVTNWAIGVRMMMTALGLISPNGTAPRHRM